MEVVIKKSHSFIINKILRERPVLWQSEFICNPQTWFKLYTNLSIRRQGNDGIKSPRTEKTGVHSRQTLSQRRHKFAAGQVLIWRSARLDGN